MAGEVRGSDSVLSRPSCSPRAQRFPVPGRTGDEEQGAANPGLVYPLALSLFLIVVVLAVHYPLNVGRDVSKVNSVKQEGTVTCSQAFGKYWRNMRLAILSDGEIFPLSCGAEMEIGSFSIFFWCRFLLQEYWLMI